MPPKAGSDRHREGGRPEITIPETEPPTRLQVQPLIKGKGKKIGANDAVTFNYRWVRWSDGKLLEESYGGKPASAALSGLLSGMVKGLHRTDRRQPSVARSPAAEGYPDGNPTPSLGPQRDPGHAWSICSSPRGSRPEWSERGRRTGPSPRRPESSRVVVAPCGPCWKAGSVNHQDRPQAGRDRPEPGGAAQSATPAATAWASSSHRWRPGISGKIRHRDSGRVQRHSSVRGQAVMGDAPMSLRVGRLAEIRKVPTGRPPNTAAALIASAGRHPGEAPAGARYRGSPDPESRPPGRRPARVGRPEGPEWKVTASRSPPKACPTVTDPASSPAARRSATERGERQRQGALVAHHIDDSGAERSYSIASRIGARAECRSATTTGIASMESPSSRFSCDGSARALVVGSSNVPVAGSSSAL